MANPRQRRKARSSSHKPVSHSKRAKRILKKIPPIRGPKVLQEAWDKHKTVRQNYEALGLVSNLNPVSSGGVERELLIPRMGADEDMTAVAKFSNKPSSKPSVIPQGHGKILRDEEGNVIGVELSEDQEDRRNDDDEDAEMRGPEVDPHVLSSWVHDLGGSSKEQSGTKGGDVIKALETMACSRTGPQIRFTSDGEVAYLTRLSKKYGSDFESMAKDRRLNPEQKTAGQLRRATNIGKGGGI